MPFVITASGSISLPGRGKRCFTSKMGWKCTVIQRYVRRCSVWMRPWASRVYFAARRLQRNAAPLHNALFWYVWCIGSLSHRDRNDTVTYPSLATHALICVHSAHKPIKLCRHTVEPNVRSGSFIDHCLYFTAVHINSLRIYFSYEASDVEICRMTLAQALHFLSKRTLRAGHFQIIFQRHSYLSRKLFFFVVVETLCYRCSFVLPFSWSENTTLV